MINPPTTIVQDSFQQAWREGASFLKDHGWEARNLVVHVLDTTSFDNDFHEVYSDFCDKYSVLGPKHVAYTIFPHNLYKTRRTAERLFKSYNRTGGLYLRLRKRPRSNWGTYFHRMTNYQGNHGMLNQLENIIRAINDRDRTHKAAYCIVIQNPGGETIRPRGGPCLNYLAIQMEPSGRRPTLGLLSVYRNHDYLERAYGNYWGLCNLICFLAEQTKSVPGPLTCVSSRAYIDRIKAELSQLLYSLR